jgi:hypothetical protein
MEKEVENEQINKKRKRTGIDVYNDLNNNGWNREENRISTKKTWAAMNIFQI